MPLRRREMKIDSRLYSVHPNPTTFLFCQREGTMFINSQATLASKDFVALPVDYLSLTERPSG
jgi:hypothetical protein